MVLGVLLCDDVRPELQEKHGNYPQMFNELFKPVDPTMLLNFYRVIDGQYPETLDECDAYITSGSRYSVNDAARWIGVFEAFIHQLYHQQIPYIGICFGHQMIARSLGGEVYPSFNGWAIGVKSVALNQEETRRHSWITDDVETYSLIVSHNDQIAELPPETLVLASSEYCPYAMIQVGDHFLGIQGHPEFTPAYTYDLIQCLKNRFSEQERDSAQASLDSKTDHLTVTQWIVNFIKQRHLDLSQ
ncbi:Glutamine amidotransferase, class I [Photobacterium marinum]|uniref:Glutamine amidotransferase, class I n=1 Tax=Photobacterium marinum TaxID=1056511 RepID=L8J9R8_9GAMM|nr:GMP synthase [Photobacterium marinum]ELR64254.1 Glutamine amidotransferase, class I [Photobacterium marinum]